MYLVSIATYLLKVSKFQKQIILSSHSPKNQRNFSHFSALASKKSWKIVQTQDESTKILIWCYLTQWNSFIALIRPLLKARAKNVKNFVGFLGNEKTRLFAFEIYWPLETYRNKLEKTGFFMVTSDPESSLGGGALVNNDNSSFCCLQVEDRSLTLASRSWFTLLISYKKQTLSLITISYKVIP